MALLMDALTMPVLGAPRLLLWLARTIAQEAQRQLWDEGGVRAQLLQLQERYDAGDLEEREYDLQEAALLERLNAIREIKDA